MDEAIVWQWSLLIAFGMFFLLLAPFSKAKSAFFKATNEKGNKPTAFLLTSSLLISWIFAKSITNAANLGAEYGLFGGFAYACYYFSFLVAGVVIYRMRTKGGFESIHHFLENKYGRTAIGLFSILIAIRLFNEVWSNSMVIGLYFGETGSSSYYTAILVFTALTLAYVLKGGLRSSLLTDVIQLVFFGVLLIVLLVFLLPDSVATPVLETKAQNNLGAFNFMLLALLQVFSYPFHDPVLTDRAFISDHKTTLKSFIWATFLGVILLTVFSYIGVEASSRGVEGDAAAGLSRELGLLAMLVMNFIMVTSAASTLDSSFSSFSKLTVLDLKIGELKPVFNGRLAMILIAVLGTLPVFAGPEILDATTISGTMVLGLAPVFIFWNRKTPRISFYLAILGGLFVGALVALESWPEYLTFSTGPYSDILWANAIGTILVFLLFLIPMLGSNGKK